MSCKTATIEELPGVSATVIDPVYTAEISDVPAPSATISETAGASATITDLPGVSAVVDDC